MGKFRVTKKRDIPVIKFDQCVAKTTENGAPGLSVEAHCEHVGAVARALRERLPSNMQKQIPLESPALIALHDVGKVSPGFTKNIFLPEELERRASGLSQLDDSGFEANHAEISEASLLAYHRTRGGATTDWEAWGEVLGNHHGKRKRPDRDTSGKYGGKSWAGERRKLLERLLDIFGNLPSAPPRDEQVALLSGMTCISDWIGSDTTFFPAEGLATDTDVFAKADEALDACGWVFPKLKAHLSFRDVFENDPYPVQAVFGEVVTRPGLYVLEASMGQGKTEAALYAAYQLMTKGYHHGLYFALPTRLTSNRIYERVNRFLDKIVEGGYQNARLIHSTAWLQRQAGGEELRAGHAWFHPSKRSLLCPFGVGTIDQALMSVLRVKHHFVRAFGLAGKVVILDEVHSYDVYTGTLLDKLVQTLLKLGCTVMILSATLTHDRRTSFFATQSIPKENAYPRITFGHNQPEVKAVAPPEGQTVYIQMTSQDRRALAALAVERARQGQCVLWINNTVDGAQESYRAALAERAEGDGEVGLLHSRFPAYRREELEDEWMKKLGKNGTRPNGCVLCATQVVEQSVDIDVDFMITDLAPTDMMLQRVGRLWRHSGRKRLCERAELYIVCPDLADIEDADVLIDALDKSAKVYAPYVLWQSYRVWKNLKKVNLPNDIRGLLEATYVQPDKTESSEMVLSLYAKLDHEREKLRSKALGSTAEAMPILEDDERVVTRYSTYEQVPALLINSRDSTSRKATLILADGTRVVADGVKNFRTAVALHKNLVNVPRYWIGKGLKTPDYLKAHVYGDIAVLTIGADGQLTGSNTYPLGYDDQKGIHKIEDTPEWEEINDEFDW